MSRVYLALILALAGCEKSVGDCTQTGDCAIGEVKVISTPKAQDAIIDGKDCIERGTSKNIDYAPIEPSGWLPMAAPPALVDVSGKVVCKDMDKVLEAIKVELNYNCCGDVECKNSGVCGIFNPLKGKPDGKDAAGEFWKIRKGDYVGLEKRK